MGPENFQNHQEENQNTGWENMQDIEKATPKSMILEKIKNNNNVKKVFAAVGLAAGLAAGVAGLSSNSEPATQNLATETADINYDEMLGQIQNIKDNFSNVADRISAQRERDARMYESKNTPEPPERPLPTRHPELPSNELSGGESEEIKKLREEARVQNIKHDLSSQEVKDSRFEQNKPAQSQSISSSETPNSYEWVLSSEQEADYTPAGHFDIPAESQQNYADQTKDDEADRSPVIHDEPELASDSEQPAGSEDWNNWGDPVD